MWTRTVMERTSDVIPIPVCADTSLEHMPVCLSSLEHVMIKTHEHLCWSIMNQKTANGFYFWWVKSSKKLRKQNVIAY
jgi:hypothetical protein